MESSMKFVFEPLTSTAVIKVEETLRPLHVTSSPMVSALTTSTFVSQLYSPMSSLTSQSTFGSQISLSSVTTVSILGSSTEHTSRSISLMTSSQDEETETSVIITLSAIISKRTISPTNFSLYSPIISYTSGTLLGSSVANIMRLPETSMKYSSEFISEPFISTALIEGEETGRPLNITSPSLATSTLVSLLYSPMFSFTSETTFGSQDSLTTVTTESTLESSTEFIPKSISLMTSTRVEETETSVNEALSAIFPTTTLSPIDTSLYSPIFSYTYGTSFGSSVSNITGLLETSMEFSTEFISKPFISTVLTEGEETERPLNITSPSLATSTFVSLLYAPMFSFTSETSFGSLDSLTTVTTESTLESSTEFISKSISLMTSTQVEETETSVNITLSAIISKRTISPTNFSLYSPIISYTSGTLLGSSVANITRLPETSMKYSTEFISEPFISTALIEGEETERPLNITSPSLAASTFVSLLYSPTVSFTSETTFGSQVSLTTVTTESTLESSTEFISKSISLMTSTRVEETEISVNETLSAIFPTTTISPIDTSLYSQIFSYTYGTSFGSSVSNITRLRETSMEFSTEFISEHFISTVLIEGEETELPLNITLSSMILAVTTSTFVFQFYSPMSSLTSETTFGSLDSLTTVTTEPISKSSTESISKSISLMTSTQIEEIEHSVNKTLSAIISTRTISPTNTSLYSPIISYTSGTSLGSSVSNITGLPEPSMEYSTEFISEPFISTALSKGEESKRPLNITSSSMRSALTTCTFVSLLYSPTVSFTSETTFSSQVSLTTGTTESVLESSTEFTSRSISLMTSTQVEETETSVNETLSAIFSTKTISPIDTSLYSPIFSYTYGTSFGSLVANITGLPETSMEYSTEFISEPFISTALTEGEETELSLNITSSSMILAVRPSTFVSQLYSPMSSLTSETTFGSLVSLTTVTTEPISKSSTESISKSISLMTSTQVEETETSVNKTLSAIFSTKTILPTDTLLYSPIISYILKTSFGSSVSNITGLPETSIKSSTEFSEALITRALTEVEETKRPLNITTSSMISAVTTSTFVSQFYSPMSSFTSQTTFGSQELLTTLTTESILELSTEFISKSTSLITTTQVEETDTSVNKTLSLIISTKTISPSDSSLISPIFSYTSETSFGSSVANITRLPETSIKSSTEFSEVLITTALTEFEETKRSLNITTSSMISAVTTSTFVSQFYSPMSSFTSQTTFGSQELLTTLTTESILELLTEFISKSTSLMTSIQVEETETSVNKTLSLIISTKTKSPSDSSLISSIFSYTLETSFGSSGANITALPETSIKSSTEFSEVFITTALTEVEETKRTLNITMSSMISAMTTSTFVSQLYSPMSSLTSKITFGSQVSLKTSTTESVLESSTEFTSRSISLMTSTQVEETEPSVNKTLPAIISTKTISPSDTSLISSIFSYTSETSFGSSGANITGLPETSIKSSTEFSEVLITTALTEVEETKRSLNITTSSMISAMTTSTFVSQFYSPMSSFTSQTTFGSQELLTTLTTESILELSTEFISKSTSLMTTTQVEETETSVNKTLSAIISTKTISPSDTSLISSIFSYTLVTSFGSSGAYITGLPETSIKSSTEFSEVLIKTALTEVEETKRPLNITSSSMRSAVTTSTFVSQLYSPMSLFTSQTTFGSQELLTNLTTESILELSTEFISKSTSLITTTQVEETDTSVNKTLSLIISTKTISPSDSSLISPIFSYTSETSFRSSVANITRLPETSIKSSTEFSAVLITTALTEFEETKRSLNITTSSMISAVTTSTFVSQFYSPMSSFTSQTTFGSQELLTTLTTESILELSTEFISKSTSLMTATQVEETETSVNKTLSLIISTKTISPSDTFLISPIFSYTLETSFGSSGANITRLPETSIKSSTEFSEVLITTALTEVEETKRPLNITTSSMISAVTSTFVSQVYSPMSSFTSQTTFGSQELLTTLTTESILELSTEFISKSTSLMTTTQVEETETSVNKTLSLIISTKTISPSDSSLISSIFSYTLVTSFGSSGANITRLPETSIKSSTEFSEVLITTALTEVEETKRPLNITTSSMISAVTTSTFVSQLYSPMSSRTSQTTFGSQELLTTLTTESILELSTEFISKSTSLMTTTQVEETETSVNKTLSLIISTKTISPSDTSLISPIFSYTLETSFGSSGANITRLPETSIKSSTEFSEVLITTALTEVEETKRPLNITSSSMRSAVTTSTFVSQLYSPMSLFTSQTTFGSQELLTTLTTESILELSTEFISKSTSLITTTQVEETDTSVNKTLSLIISTKTISPSDSSLISSIFSYTLVTSFGSSGANITGLPETSIKSSTEFSEVLITTALTEVEETKRSLNITTSSMISTVTTSAFVSQLYSPMSSFTSQTTFGSQELLTTLTTESILELLTEFISKSTSLMTSTQVEETETSVNKTLSAIISTKTISPSDTSLYSPIILYTSETSFGSSGANITRLPETSIKSSTEFSEALITTALTEVEETKRPLNITTSSMIAAVTSTFDSQFYSPMSSFTSQTTFGSQELLTTLTTESILELSTEFISKSTSLMTTTQVEETETSVNKTLSAIISTKTISPSDTSLISSIFSYTLETSFGSSGANITGLPETSIKSSTEFSEVLITTALTEVEETKRPLNITTSSMRSALTTSTFVSLLYSPMSSFTSETTFGSQVSLTTVSTKSLLELSTEFISKSTSLITTTQVEETETSVNKTLSSLISTQTISPSDTSLISSIISYTSETSFGFSVTNITGLPETPIKSSTVFISKPFISTALTKGKTTERSLNISSLSMISAVATSTFVSQLYSPMSLLTSETAFGSQISPTAVITTTKSAPESVLKTLSLNVSVTTMAKFSSATSSYITAVSSSTIEEYLSTNVSLTKGTYLQNQQFLSEYVDEIGKVELMVPKNMPQTPIKLLGNLIEIIHKITRKWRKEKPDKPTQNETSTTKIQTPVHKSSKKSTFRRSSKKSARSSTKTTSPFSVKTTETLTSTNTETEKKGVLEFEVKETKSFTKAVQFTRRPFLWSSTHSITLSIKEKETTTPSSTTSPPDITIAVTSFLTSVISPSTITSVEEEKETGALDFEIVMETKRLTRMLNLTTLTKIILLSPISETKTSPCTTPLPTFHVTTTKPATETLLKIFSSFVSTTVEEERTSLVTTPSPDILPTITTFLTAVTSSFITFTSETHPNISVSQFKINIIVTTIKSATESMSTELSAIESTSPLKISPTITSFLTSVTLSLITFTSESPPSISVSLLETSITVTTMKLVTESVLKTVSADQFLTVEETKSLLIVTSPPHISPTITSFLTSQLETSISVTTMKSTTESMSTELSAIELSTVEETKSSLSATSALNISHTLIYFLTSVTSPLITFTSESPTSISVSQLEANMTVTTMKSATESVLKTVSADEVLTVEETISSLSVTSPPHISPTITSFLTSQLETSIVITTMKSVNESMSTELSAIELSTVEETKSSLSLTSPLNVSPTITSSPTSVISHLITFTSESPPNISISQLETSITVTTVKSATESMSTQLSAIESTVEDTKSSSGVSSALNVSPTITSSLTSVISPLITFTSENPHNISVSQVETSITVTTVKSTTQSMSRELSAIESTVEETKSSLSLTSPLNVSPTITSSLTSVTSPLITFTSESPPNISVSQLETSITVTTVKSATESMSTQLSAIESTVEETKSSLSVTSALNVSPTTTSSLTSVTSPLITFTSESPSSISVSQLETSIAVTTVKSATESMSTQLSAIESTVEEISIIR
ncbi:uncharacterized threonine-rich GPI-anchored glycoprotein PJ4664.02-like [Teleopsis dalmanni]|uniref:uncharacterized threonine-rich GPI-anchored glycoprotein PJ4664.02-like n=1 Tax=Teleopsis dalmanni TaxID=139649 RepID=UPI0018CC972E|nr:uncharacterized threonine-rich GPI-anchored glycoprotein PJ4664.02-like [Teleopsis dalmanni]